MQITEIITIFAQIKTNCAQIREKRTIQLMAIGRTMQRIENKKLLFEYLVYLLEQWKEEMHPHSKEAFTKLKLQKILFLVASVNAVEDNHPLLDVFDNFYALPYGPVEIDIYEAMCNNDFKTIKFEGNYCKHSLNDDNFTALDEKRKKAMSEAVQAIKGKGADYINTDAFELVEITHKWTSWQIAIQMAEMFGSKRESMSTEDIINSTVKAY